MKTKIVYTLVSDCSDNYLQQAIISLYSLRLYNSSAVVELVVDTDTANTLLNERAEILLYIDKLHTIECPVNFSKQQRSRQLKTTLRNIIEGDYLFIDTDTIIGGDLSEVDSLNMTIGAVKDKHVSLIKHPMTEAIKHWAEIVEWKSKEDVYFNSGVFYVKDRAEAYEFYKMWNEEWNNSRNKGLNLDQPSLGKTNSQNSLKIKEIDGCWNCQISDNGLRFLSNAKIIHYFASMQTFDTIEEIPYLFRNPQIFIKLKENKNKVNSELHNMIMNAKTMFPEVITLSTGRNSDLQNTKTYRALRKLYFTHRKVFNKLEWILKKFF